MPAKKNSLVDLVELHLSWYPFMETRDIYKLIYQGVMGPEHLIPSSEVFLSKLEEEFERAIPDQDERLTEPVSCDHTVYRVNLRAYKYRHRRIQRLFKSVMETARGISGELIDVRRLWMDFVRACESGILINFILEDILEFTTWLEKHQYPAVHHSEVYHQRYQPSYRIISHQFIPLLEPGKRG
jgi:hypothetical protein